jgi:hypothetical protein
MPAEVDDKLLIWSAGTLYMRTLCATSFRTESPMDKAIYFEVTDGPDIVRIEPLRWTHSKGL